MSEAKRCPSCGYVLSPESAPNSPEADLSAFDLLPATDLESRLRPLDPAEPDAPPIPLMATDSSDDAFVEMPRGQWAAEPEPNQALGAIASSLATPSIESARQPCPPHSVPSSSTHFPAIITDAPSSSAPNSALAFRALEDWSDNGEVEPEHRRFSWASVVLFSYANAITLALVWTIIKNRSDHKPETGLRETSGAVATQNPARQAGLSRKVEPPEPILGEHFATFGKPLQVGSLEITPIDVKRHDVQLQPANAHASPSRKDGGKKALVLRLRLRNTTDDSTFAPLDQGYLRERGKGIVDTYVETADHQKVYPFPLAVDSELSIVGQDFAELRPGESKVFAIFSAPDAPPDSAGPFTWRVRLRTGINRTDTIGVRWQEEPDKPKETSQIDCTHQPKQNSNLKLKFKRS
jgi:hypothetical protein